MRRVVLVGGMLLVFGVMKLPAERALTLQHRQLQFADIANLDLREKLGQLGFIAALSGFRAVVADFLFIEAHAAWERTEWGPRFVLVSTGDNIAAARPALLGHGRLAHGLERKHGGDERYVATANGAASQSAA